MNSRAVSQPESVRFAKLCRAILRDCGFTIDGEQVDFAEAGVTVDLVATNRRAISFYIVCKGSYHGRQPGLQRAATLRQALAAAQTLHTHGWGPILILTSHLPKTRGGQALLADVDPEVLFETIDVLRNSRRLRWLAHADEALLRRDLDARRVLFLQADRHTARSSSRARRGNQRPTHTELTDGRGDNLCVPAQPADGHLANGDTAPAPSRATPAGVLPQADPAA